MVQLESDDLTSRVWPDQLHDWFNTRSDPIDWSNQRGKKEWEGEEGFVNESGSCCGGGREWKKGGRRICEFLFHSKRIC